MATTRVILSYPWNGNKTYSPDANEELGMSEAVQKIARKELREDTSAREQSLTQFREWIAKNQDIENVRTDDRFLLRFLRVKKFSVPMAQQMLLKYLNFRKTFAHMMGQLDHLDPMVADLISRGYIFASPIKDKCGRRVIISFAKNFDTQLHTSGDMAKAHMVVYETLLEDAENQVVGFTHVGDIQGISAAIVTAWNPTEFAKIVKWGEQSVPMRHKEIHLTNVPQPIKWVVDFAKSRVSQKIKERFQTHLNVEELHKKVDASALPKEMGGTIPMADMIESFKKELAAKRDLLLASDKMKLLSDRQIVVKHDKNNNGSELESISGSFRKLEVD